MPRRRSMPDDEIVDAAVAAVGEHGPAKLTLAHVAEACGLAPATLVQRFGSKAGLLDAVARAGATQAEAAFDRVDASRPLEAVVTALGALAADVSSRRQLANHLAMLQLDLADPERRRSAAEQARIVRRRIAGLLDAAVAAGELRPCDTAALARTVHAVYNGALITWAVEGRGSLASWIRGHVHAVTGPYEPTPSPQDQPGAGRARKEQRR